MGYIKLQKIEIGQTYKQNRRRPNLTKKRLKIHQEAMVRWNPETGNTRMERGLPWTVSVRRRYLCHLVTLTILHQDGRIRWRKVDKPNRNKNALKKQHFFLIKRGRVSNHYWDLKSTYYILRRIVVIASFPESKKSYLFPQCGISLKIMSCS